MVQNDFVAYVAIVVRGDDLFDGRHISCNAILQWVTLLSERHEQSSDGMSDLIISVAALRDQFFIRPSTKSAHAVHAVSETSAKLDVWSPNSR